MTVTELQNKREALEYEIKQIDRQIEELRLKETDVLKFKDKYIKFEIIPCVITYMRVDRIEYMPCTGWRFSGPGMDSTITKIRCDYRFLSNIERMFNVDTLSKIKIISEEQFKDKLESSINFINRQYETN